MKASAVLLQVLGLLALTSGGREETAPLTFALVGDVSVGRGVAQMNAADWSVALSDVRVALRAEIRQAAWGLLTGALSVRWRLGSTGIASSVHVGVVCSYRPGTILFLKLFIVISDGFFFAVTSCRRHSRCLLIVEVFRKVLILIFDVVTII